MSKMLTTKEIQDLLNIDRSTVYRMVEAGQLPGVKVGKQWRFPADQIKDWVQCQAATPMADPETGGHDFASLLPLTCAQILQDVFAETLGVMIVTTDMRGNPVTEVSHPCGLFSLIHQSPAALQKCIAGWRNMANILDFQPKFTRCPLGLLGTRGLVRSGTELMGLVIIGGIAPDDWPPAAAEVNALATEFDLAAEVLLPCLSDVFYLAKEQRALVLSQVQRIADILTLIIAERAALIGKLESIAELVTLP